MIERILVATDFSEWSAVALRTAISLAERMGASIDVVHVWEPSASIPIETMLTEVSTGAPRTLGEIARREAARRMTHFLEAEGSTSVQLGSRIEVGRPDEVLVTLAEQEGHDLIVIGTHGRSGLARVLMGSVADRVLRHAPCPVLTVRGPAQT